MPIINYPNVIQVREMKCIEYNETVLNTEENGNIKMTGYPGTRQWGGDCLWEQGLDRAGESSGGNGDNCN